MRILLVNILPNQRIHNLNKLTTTIPQALYRDHFALMRLSLIGLEDMGGSLSTWQTSSTLRIFRFFRSTTPYSVTMLEDLDLRLGKLLVSFC